VYIPSTSLHFSANKITEHSLFIRFYRDVGDLLGYPSANWICCGGRVKLFRNQFHFLNRIVVGSLLLFNVPQMKRGASTTQVQGMEEGEGEYHLIFTGLRVGKWCKGL